MQAWSILDRAESMCSSGLYPVTACETAMPHESPRGISQLLWFLFPLFKAPSSLKLKSLRPLKDRVLSQKLLH